jgi:hypothetical protein
MEEIIDNLIIIGTTVQNVQCSRSCHCYTEHDPSISGLMAPAMHVCVVDLSICPVCNVISEM